MFGAESVLQSCCKMPNAFAMSAAANGRNVGASELYFARPPASLFPLGFPFSPKRNGRAGGERDLCHSLLTNLI
jgi:hypothetical protein